MKSPSWILMLATTIGACSAPDTTGVPLTTSRAFNAHTQDLQGTPDLVVDAQKLATSWVIYDELVPNVCSAQEGGVTPGQHMLLRFTVTTPNIGTADVYIGDPNVHYDPNGDGDPADSDGLFELASCHGHYHFRNYASYELYPVNTDGSLGTAIGAAKRGFCMIDVTPYDNSRSWYYRNCGRPEIPSLGLPAIAGNQGISAGWADTYVKWLAGQYFVIDGLPGGTYLLRIVVNPPFDPGGPSCAFTDGLGKCHNFEESDYTNNVGEVYITIPEGRPGKMGWGPGGNQLVPSNAWTKAEDSDDKNK